MVKKIQHFTVQVWGDYACFKRLESRLPDSLKMLSAKTAFFYGVHSEAEFFSPYEKDRLKAIEIE